MDDMAGEHAAQSGARRTRLRRTDLRRSGRHTKSVERAASGPERGGLWRHRDFMFLWAGQSISEIGSAVTIVALPLVAVVLLHASTFQVGLLTAAGTACFLLVALPAGLVVDRVAKRRLMIWCDIVRLMIIGSVAVTAAFGVLTMAQLLIVALLLGLATVFFDVAYQS